MPVFTDVQTGEVKIALGTGILSSSAIGSCIAVVAYDKLRHNAGLAHVMLPGRAPVNAVDRLRFADDALDELVGRMTTAGSQLADIQLCLAGGGNVLNRADDTICDSNIRSVTQAVRRQGLLILARSLGGTRRRRVRIDVGAGSVWCAEGDDAERLLWRWCLKAQLSPVRNV
jgi:chemotaxis protein CheD